MCSGADNGLPSYHYGLLIQLHAGFFMAWGKHYGGGPGCKGLLAWVRCVVAGRRTRSQPWCFHRSMCRCEQCKARMKPQFISQNILLGSVTLKQRACTEVFWAGVYACGGLLWRWPEKVLHGTLGYTDKAVYEASLYISSLKWSGCKTQLLIAVLAQRRCAGMLWAVVWGQEWAAGGAGMKSGGCGGDFNRLCEPKSAMLWTCALGFLLHGQQDLTSAEIQLLGELWPTTKMCRAVFISIAWKMKLWGQCE